MFKIVCRNLGDNLTFANSMRNFYSMPNTTIPNNQKDFALFCVKNKFNASYKDIPDEKYEEVLKYIKFLKENPS